MKKFQTILASAVAVCAFHVSTSSVAADEVVAERNVLEEIVVTASRRSQTLQETSIAVSAISGDDLQSLAAVELQDYFGLIPSMNAAHNMIGQRGGQNIIIRGISNSRVAVINDAATLSATTAFYLDDVPAVPLDTSLFDIERVEVLRGPQGTLYGAAAMGGAVKLFHKRPNLHDVEGSIRTSANWIQSGGQGQQVDGMLNMPIIDGILGVRFVGSHRQKDGYVDSIIIPLTHTQPNTAYPLSPAMDIVIGEASDRIKPDANGVKSQGARGSILYTPSERLSLEAAVLWQRMEADDLGFSNTHFNQRLLQEKYLLEPNSSEMTLTSLNATYDLGPVTLNSITSAYSRDYDETLDYTPILYGSYASDLDYVPAKGSQQSLSDTRTYTQELRLQSNLDDQTGFLGRIEWVIGAFWMDERRLVSYLVDAPGWSAAAPNNPLPVANDIFATNTSEINDESKAAFANVTFNLTDTLSLDAGLRYFEVSTESASQGTLSSSSPTVPIVSLPRSYSGDGTTPRFALSYKPSDKTHVYGSYSEGFRLGGAGSPMSNISPQCLEVLTENDLLQFAGGGYDSDTVITYDLGIKRTFGSGSTVVNGSIYTTDWEDLQQLVRLANFPGSLCAGTVTANVGSAKVDGAELEVATMATDKLVIRSSVSYTDARIVDPGSGSIGAKGDRLQNVPEWSGSIAADFETETNVLGGATLFLHGDVRYMGERTPVVGEAPNPLLELDPYTIVRLRAGLTFGENPVTVSLFANNVFDERIELNARARVGVSSNIVVGEDTRRVIGIELRKDF